MERSRAETSAATNCSYKNGTLPSSAPLATSWVPVQGYNPETYSGMDALTRGTLFPGLDLPFMNMVNKTNPYANTPLGELMALKFMIQELQLYLDTHQDDKEALRALRETIKLSKEAQRRYVQKYGPLEIKDMADFDTYAWINDPWPWEYCERTGN